MTLRLAELCAGYGGLGLALDVLGWPVELAWYAENDPDADAVMAKHHPGVANLGDITEADWSRAEPVDVIAAGYPCQSFSHAGLRKGWDDERAVWPYVADAIRHLRPRLVLLENVAGHVVRGFPRVLGDLSALGYDAQWTCVRASDVGAPHQRDRLFVYAYPADPGGQRVRVEPVPVGACDGAAVIGGDREGSSGVDLLPTPTAREMHGAGRNGREGGPNLRTSIANLPTPAHAGRWGRYTAAIQRWEHITGRPVPEPTEPGVRGGPRLSARFVEWLMSLPAGYVTDVLPRNSALRVLGNGVVPPQAAMALRALAGVAS